MVGDRSSGSCTISRQKAEGSRFSIRLKEALLLQSHGSFPPIRRIFEIKGWELPEQMPVLPHEREAYEVTLRELSARVKEN